MGNHVIYDAMWESDRLAECSREAALAYPWIFLVADDHGRFEYRPRAIWKHAFAYRKDVSVEDVERWLTEYWKVGLLIRYHIDGDLAYWYKFVGRKESDRKKSKLPDPAGVPEFKWPGDANPLEGGGNPRKPAETRGNPPTSRLRSEQIGSRAEQEQERNLAPAPPSPLALAKSGPWSREAVDDWNARFGAGSAKGSVIGNQLAPLVKANGWERVRPAWRRYLAEKEPEFCNPADFASHFGHWSGPPARAAPRKSTVADRSREVYGLNRGGQVAVGDRVSQGDAHTARRLQPGAERGHPGSVLPGAEGSDGPEFPGGGG